MDYEKEYEEYAQQHMSRGRLLMSKIFKVLVRVFSFGIIALVLWRVIFSTRVPGDIKALTVNDAVMQAYEAGELDIYTQDIAPVNMDGDTAGYFWACQVLVIPKAGQVQVLIRYNNGTLRHIAQDFGLGEDGVPARDEDVLDVTLAVWVDPDPDNETTTDRELVRIQPTGEATADRTAMYNYRRYVFDGVDTDVANLINMSVDIYYKGSVNYDRAAYSSIVVYEPDRETLAYDLTGHDKLALRDFGAGKGE